MKNFKPGKFQWLRVKRKFNESKKAKKLTYEILNFCKHIVRLISLS